MSWGKAETLIEQRRAEMCRDPRSTIAALYGDLRRKDLRPRERTRLLGLLVAGYRHTANWDRAEAALAEALLTQVQDLGEHVVITRSGRPAGILLPVDEYDPCWRRSTSSRARRCRKPFATGSRKSPRATW